MAGPRAGAGAPWPGSRNRPPLSTPGGMLTSTVAPLPVRTVRLPPSAASANVTSSLPIASAPRGQAPVTSRALERLMPAAEDAGGGEFHDM